MVEKRLVRNEKARSSGKSSRIMLLQNDMRKFAKWVLIALILALANLQLNFAFQSDELSEEDEEWGLVGAGPLKFSEKPRVGGANGGVSSSSSSSSADRIKAAALAADKKIQFTLEHSFGGSEFRPAGVFTARVRESGKGGQTLTKFRLTRNGFSEEEQEEFQELLDSDGFYTIRVPSNTLNPGKSFVISSVKARCLASSNFQERFDFQMDHGHVIGVTYGGSKSCSYPRPLQVPSDWNFDSDIITKTSRPAERPLVAPQVVDTAAEEDQLTEDGQPTVKKLPERSFWAKYWMYIVPIGLIVVNAITQIANMPEEGAPPGQAGGVPQQRVGGPAAGPRRR